MKHNIGTILGVGWIRNRVEWGGDKVNLDSIKGRVILKPLKDYQFLETVSAICSCPVSKFFTKIIRM